jgi:hypothetical protein
MKLTFATGYMNKAAVITGSWWFEVWSWGPAQGMPFDGQTPGYRCGFVRLCGRELYWFW